MTDSSSAFLWTATQPTTQPALRYHSSGQPDVLLSESREASTESTRIQGLLGLPNELLFMVAFHLCGHCKRDNVNEFVGVEQHDKKDILNLSRVHRRLRDAAQPYICHSYRICRKVLLFLYTMIRRPDLARCVQRVFFLPASSHLTLRKARGSVPAVRQASKRLGLQFTEHPRWWAVSSPARQCFLEEMVLLLTPNVRDLIVHRPATWTENFFEHLRTVSENRGWTGLRRLGRVVLLNETLTRLTQAPVGHSRMSNIEILPLIAPNLRTLVADIAGAEDCLVQRERTAAFLANLTSLWLLSRQGQTTRVAEVKVLLSYCTRLEQFVFFAAQTSSFGDVLDTLKGLAPTLKSLHLQTALFTFEKHWSWMPLLESLISLEVLGLKSEQCRNMTPWHFEALVNVLPPRVRILRTSACCWFALGTGINNLKERKRRDELCHLRRLYFDCGLGVEMS